jgi:hypothetical protein
VNTLTRFGRLIGMAMLPAGILLALYGVFAILYGGDSGGDGNTYVKFGGREVDADVVGAVALSLGLVALVAAALLVRRARRNPSR